MKTIHVTIFGIFLILLISYVLLQNDSIRNAYVAEKEYREELVHTLLNENDTDFTVGATNPTVRLIVYSDTECPACRDFVPPLEQLLETYPEDVALTYRHNQSNTYPHSRFERPALECVGIIEGAEAFHSFHTTLLQQTYSGNEALEQAILFLGEEDRTSLTECVNDPNTLTRIETDISSGKVLGVNTSPSWFVTGAHIKNPRMYPGQYRYDNLLYVVEQEMEM